MNRIEEATQSGHELSLYPDSEMADETAKEKKFDALWQSIYDVCKCIYYGIFDDFDQEEYDEAMVWLKQYQDLTEDYKELSLEFK